MTAHKLDQGFQMCRQNWFLLLWQVHAYMGGRSPGLGQVSSTTKREDLEGNSRREPRSRRKPCKGQALILLPLEQEEWWPPVAPVNTGSARSTFACTSGPAPLPRWQDSPRTLMAAQLSPGSTGRGREVNTGLPSSFRKETGQQQGNGAWQKRGCLLSEMGQWLIEICQKYYREKYRVITFSIAPRILRWQNIFNDCFCLVESIISW